MPSFGRQVHVREALMLFRILLRSFALLLALFAFTAITLVAQDDTSVADAARRAQQQKQNAAKPARVIDNDSLPPAPAGTSAPTPAAPAPDANSPAPAADASADSAAEKKDAADEERNKKEIDQLKQEIAEKKQKLNLEQRELALDQDTYISNPSHDQDKAGKEKLDSMQSDIAQAQSELDELVAKLAALAPPADASAPASTTPAAPATPEQQPKP
jgi:hypothetical protein